MKGMKLKEKIKYWGQLFLLPLYLFSFLTPRDRRIWLFGSSFGNRFADNPKYFYLFLSKHKEEEIRPVWISKKQEVVDFLISNGYEAYKAGSVMGIWMCLRGKVYLFDNYSKDISFWLSGGAIKFNLWHGSGNKMTNHDNAFDKVRHPANLWERFLTFPRRLSDEKPNHYTLATSEAMEKITISAFATDKSHVIVDGYPRNDAVMDDSYPNLLNKKEQMNRDQLRDWKEQGLKIDFYMPTFRDSEVDFFQVMDLDQFNKFLKEQKLMFVIKVHSKSKLKQVISKIDYSHIKVIDADIDPYTFLDLVDLLTTDYSSIYTDFMLLNRPVVGFPFDLDKYGSDTRAGYIPHDEYMPELKSMNMEELMDNTIKVLENDVCFEARQSSKARMFQYVDAEATLRLTGKVKKLAGLY